jgi:hypothetical protein
LCIGTSISARDGDPRPLSHGKTPLLIAQAVAAYIATIAIGALVAMDGELPSAFTTLFFVPIIFVAYRFPPAVSWCRSAALFGARRWPPQVPVQS